MPRRFSQSERNRCVKEVKGADSAGDPTEAGLAYFDESTQGDKTVSLFGVGDFGGGAERDFCCGSNR